MRRFYWQIWSCGQIGNESCMVRLAKGYSPLLLLQFTLITFVVLCPDIYHCQLFLPFFPLFQQNSYLQCQSCVSAQGVEPVRNEPLMQSRVMNESQLILDYIWHWLFKVNLFCWAALQWDDMRCYITGQAADFYFDPFLKPKVFHNTFALFTLASLNCLSFVFCKLKLELTFKMAAVQTTCICWSFHSTLSIWVAFIKTSPFIILLL